MTIITKYDLNQEVFFMSNNKIEKGKIYKINYSLEVGLKRESLAYIVQRFDQFGENLKEQIYEENLFLSKEALIKALYE